MECAELGPPAGKVEELGMSIITRVDAWTPTFQRIALGRKKGGLIP